VPNGDRIQCDPRAESDRVRPDHPEGTWRKSGKRFDSEWRWVARDVYCAAWKRQMLTSI
jgi:hypothetical protein